MKTNLKAVKSMFLFTLLFFVSGLLYSQTPGKQKIAVLGIDTKDIGIDKEVIRNMVLLELEKTNVYEVMDKYDVADIIKREGIDIESCYGKSCQIRVGKLLNADKMLTGNLERYGDKIIFIFRLIDVQTGNIEKTDVMEYINQPDEIQIMTRMSLNNIIERENDKFLLDLLVNFDQPIVSSKTTLRLNGPRVGFSYVFGDYAKRMQDPVSNGGFDMYPVNCMIGYQFEKQFLSSGDFQALFEVIPMLSGMESGVVIPSCSGMLGFRFNKSGIEFGLGPVFRGIKTAEGYYDSDGRWQLAETLPENSTIPTHRRLDSRGDMSVSNGMVFAFGRTFRSGYLNLPVNIYYSPRKEGSLLGIVVGFNVASRPKLTKS